MDKSAFRNGKIKSEVNVNQSQGYNDNTGEECKLKKVLYGLRKSSREWY